MSAAPATFYRRVEAALGNPTLQAAVRLSTGRMVANRQAAMAAFPEAESVRDRARAIRAHTIAHLDRYLRQFEANVVARGGRVHWAATAADAVRLVTEIAREHGVRTAVKSKSMVSEEIDLNAALAQAGVEVLESDLGEFIVQLANDHPSHIVMPIIHKSRAEIARLFRDRLQATDEDVSDVPQMTRLARRVLRAGFLHADMGISGGNFGVAATGSLCITTNEGNGRLTTTLPRVHVALMGIERLVPTFDDLAVMLQVLGRSATGQKLTVYTNIISGPRRHGQGPGAGGQGPGGESDGPEHFHVVLVDNGRSSLLGGELAEILYCIRCGACLNACPVYQQLGGHAYGSVYPGPVGAVLTPALRGLYEWHDLPQASSLCGACREICPVRIDIPRMLLELRSETTRIGYTPWWVSLGLSTLATLATRPRLFRRAQALASWATRRLATDGWIRRMPGHLARWTDARDFPAFAPQTFQQQWEARRK
ncbi:MAG TPA: LutB/LldF family L-lactate oxidation iron-sulfur protein [Vicinamibacterales bacterium]